MLSPRSPWQVTRSVWYALFMREALARTANDRMGWFWMLFEPIAHVALLSALKSLAGNIDFIAGAPVIQWLVVGLMTFFVFRDGLLRSLGAVDANAALFTYRQVMPIDTVLVRCIVELILKLIIFFILILALNMLGYEMVPGNSLAVLVGFVLVWLLGVGSGLFLSVISFLAPEIGKLVRISMFPLYLVSGVLFPLNFLPDYLQQLVLINPLVHGIEYVRLAFFQGYWSLDGISISYLIVTVLVVMNLGLLLQLRYREKLRAL